MRIRGSLFGLFATLGACAASRSIIEPPLRPAEVGAQAVLDSDTDIEATRVSSERTMSIPIPELDAATIARLHAPPGFTISIFARGIPNARMIAVDRNTGVVYVTSPRSDSVYALEDRDHDGVAETPRVAIDGLTRVHGIAIRGDQVWLAGTKEIWTADIKKDGTFATPKAILRDLPEGGLHPNRTLGFDPTGRLFVSIGSGCNACAEDNAEHATIVSMKPDGSDRRIYARGLRNTLGFAWDPKSGALWGMDHGSDDRGAEGPPEELNQLLEGANYGWPYAFGKRQVDSAMVAPGKISKADLVERSVGSTLELPPQSSPSGIVFYRGTMFPADYQGDALVTLRGPRRRVLSVGYRVVRIHFEDGQPKSVTDFLTGFTDGTNAYGRLSGIEIGNDGALLVADQRHGIIYRVSRGLMEAKN